MRNIIQFHPVSYNTVVQAWALGAWGDYRTTVLLLACLIFVSVSCMENSGVCPVW